jgi:hypothetical protein
MIKKSLLKHINRSVKALHAKLCEYDSITGIGDKTVSTSVSFQSGDLIINVTIEAQKTTCHAD